MPKFLCTLILGLSILLAGCATTSGLMSRVANSSSATTSAQGGVVTRVNPRSEASDNKPSPVGRYVSAGAFKASATTEAGIRGAGVEELSLFIAEREALRDCTKQSAYQGECEVDKIGAFNLGGLNDASQQQIRWQYMRQVHQQMMRRMPLDKMLPAKVLAPGSRVGNADLLMARTYADGGLVALRMANYSCTGTMDPIEREEEPEREEQAIGLVEFACQNEEILRGGYVYQNAQSQLFFLEDEENERWDFLISTKGQSVGSNVTAFKKLFREIEEME